MQRQSVLTELYRNCVLQIEKNFHLTHRTVCHQPPNMTKTLAVVTGHIRQKEMLVTVLGRKSRQNVLDQITAGLAKLQRQYSGLRSVADSEDTSMDEDVRDTEPDEADIDLEL